MTALVALAALALALGLAYSLLSTGMAARRAGAEHAWRSLDLELKHRHALIGELARAAGLDGVVAAREKAVRASGVADVRRAEEQLGVALAAALAPAAVREKVAAGEAAPSLERLARLDSRIEGARQAYNDAVSAYNLSLGGLSAPIARLRGLEPLPTLEWTRPRVSRRWNRIRRTRAS